MTVWFICKMPLLDSVTCFFGKTLNENMETIVIIWLYLQSFLDYSKLKQQRQILQTTIHLSSSYSYRQSHFSLEISCYGLVGLGLYRTVKLAKPDASSGHRKAARQQQPRKKDKKS